MKKKAEPAFRFVIDELSDSKIGNQISTRPMFGAHSVYVKEKIVMILRKKDDAKTARDNGIWVVTTPDYQTALQQAFPNLRPIEMFLTDGGKGVSGWLNLPESDPNFEEDAFRICEMIKSGDPRVGKIPKQKSKSKKPPRKTKKSA